MRVFCIVLSLCIWYNLTTCFQLIFVVFHNLLCSSLSSNFSYHLNQKDDMLKQKANLYIIYVSEEICACITLFVCNIYLSCALIINLIINQYFVFSCFAHIRISSLLSIIKNSVIMKLACGYHTVVISFEGDMSSHRCKDVYFNDFQWTFLLSP